MIEHQDQKIEFSIIDPAATDKDRREWGFTGTLIDISSNGVGFVTDTPLEPGNIIAFKNMEAPDSGIVMWTLKTENRYRVGVRFTEQNNQPPDVSR